MEEADRQFVIISMQKIIAVGTEYDFLLCFALYRGFACDRMNLPVVSEM